jgi:hypothetical protein
MNESRFAGIKALPTPHALTLPRLLLMTFWSLCGVSLWSLLHKPLGQFGQWVFGLLGFFVGLFVTWAILKGRILGLFPFPVCQQGRCSRMARDYVWRLGTLFGYEGKGMYLYRCGCGDMYLREGKRFMRLAENDILTPYKRLVAFRRWADDSEPIHSRSLQGMSDSSGVC